MRPFLWRHNLNLRHHLTRKLTDFFFPPPWCVVSFFISRVPPFRLLFTIFWYLFTFSAGRSGVKIHQNILYTTLGFRCFSFTWIPNTPLLFSWATLLPQRCFFQSGDFCPITRSACFFFFFFTKILSLVSPPFSFFPFFPF